MSELQNNKQNNLIVKDVFEQHSAIGLENVDSSQLVVPYLLLLQKQSTQIDTIEGARSGMFYDTVADELYDGSKPITIIPIHFRQSMIERTIPANPADKAVFVADHSDNLSLYNDCQIDDKKRRINPEGNELVKSWLFLVNIIKDDKSFNPVVIKFKTSQYTKASKWMSFLSRQQVKNSQGKLYTPAIFQNVFELSVVVESKNENKWNGYNIKFKCLINDLFPNKDVKKQEQDALDVFLQCQKFRELYTKGYVKEANDIEDHLEDVNSSSENFEI